jgi:hypothetical protein
MTGKLNPRCILLLTLALAAFGCDEAVEADPPDPDAVEDLERDAAIPADEILDDAATERCEPGEPGCPCDVTGACWAGYECVQYATAAVGVCEPLEPACGALAESCATGVNECCDGLTCVNAGNAAEPKYMCR